MKVKIAHFTEYDTLVRHNTQEDLQYLAKNIFANGTIKTVEHHTYSTNNPEQGATDETLAVIKNGSICCVVESNIAPITYYVNMIGTTVTHITERVDY